ncbi:MAG: GNAT family N-acetyltransferase [Candidatus Nucleicultricaceae bacterium]
MIVLQPATFNDYPIIQNIARFYVYDLSRSCGFISSDWAIPKDGLYESDDFKSYFEDPTRKAYLLKVGEEWAGFVLLNKMTQNPQALWNMGEFFILAKFQGKGLGRTVAHAIWRENPGNWEIMVIPENKQAHKFWQKTIQAYVGDQFTHEKVSIDFDKDQPKRILFSFKSRL